MAFCCNLFFSPEPPADGVKAGGRKGAQYGQIIRMQNHPNTFQTNLCDAPCADCPCCCATCLLPPCMACHWRMKALETYGNGVQDYVCCQGYIPKCCCLDFPNMCKGSSFGLCLEGCCCDTLSLSISRMYLMDSKQLRPDPVDYQIIAFSNCMQMLSCICHTAAMCIEQLRDLALIIDIIADIVERIVAGCMGAQISLEIKHTASTKGGGAPAVAIADEIKVSEVELAKDTVEQAAVIERD